MRFSCSRILFNDPKPFLHYLQVKQCTSGGSWLHLWGRLRYNC